MESIIGNGIDIIEIGRVKKAMQRKGFIDRIYTKNEQEYLKNKPYASWAARFAAKEAVMKALGLGLREGIRFVDIEISNDPYGKPHIILYGRSLEIANELGISRWLISLSHSKDLAIADVLAIKTECRK